MGVTISIFYKITILSKTFMPNCGQCWRETLHIVTHSYAASFSIKHVFVKLTTLSSAKISEKETKPMRNSENKS